MIIGSHVRFTDEQFLGSVKEAVSYGANAFMFYTGAPQNTRRASIKKEFITKGLELMKENNIDINNVIVHAPYIINLANKEKIDSWNFSISFLKEELNRCDELGVKYLVLHPGSSVNLTKEEGVSNIIEALKNVVNENYNCMILLETMAGKGSECGSNLEEIKTIIDSVNSSKLGVCLDTCHLNDAGYNMQDFNNFINYFTKLLDINLIKCIHINDSKNLLGSHKDRHENIGFGTIGFDTLLKIVNYDKLKSVPKILETPYINKEDNLKELVYPPYKFEIAMLKDATFNNNLKEDVREFYK